MSNTPAGLTVGTVRRGTNGATSGAGPVRHLGTSDRSSQRVRLVDAALRCYARQGISATTVDDVAREAGVSRATLYRTFQGGRDALVAAVVETETARLCAGLAVAMGSADDVEDVLVVGITTAATVLTEHPALRTVMAVEPSVVTRHLAFDALEGPLDAASSFASPFFARWLEPEQASRAAEWATRIVLSYALAPAAGMDPCDERDVRRFVRTFVLPGIQALRVRPAGAWRLGTHRPT